VKRWTDTKKWESEWYRTKTALAKNLWLWLNDHCDNAGIVTPDIALASFQIGGTIDETHIAELKDRLKEIEPGTYMILGFIHFQSGNIPARGSKTMAPFQINIWKCLTAHNIDYVNPKSNGCQHDIHEAIDSHERTIERHTHDTSVAVRQRQGLRQGQRQGLKEKGSGEKPKAENPSLMLVFAWSRAFESQFGIAYDDKKRDWSAAKTLLKSTGKTVQEIISVARDAWTKSDGRKFYNCLNRTRDFADFCSAWNKIRAELSQAPVEITKAEPAKPKAGPHPW
jgi:hypothetical protein